MLEEGRVGERYNIGGGNERTNLEIVDRICDALEELRPPASNPALEGPIELSRAQDASWPTGPGTTAGMPSTR